LTCSHPSCLEYRRLKAATEDFWLTREGITRRIDSLAQDFSFKTVNNAIKIVGKTNEAKWLQWVDKGDAKVCKDCQKHSQGGKQGYYKTSWFMPKMPAHPNCRCEWKVYFYDPFK